VDQDDTWHADRSRPWPHCVRWGPGSPPQKGSGAPQFLAHVCCGQMAASFKMPLGMEVGLHPGDCVRSGPNSPSPQGGGAHQFSAHVYCGQTAGWIKMPLGMEVSLGPDDIVLDVDPAPPPPRKRGTAPNFRPMSIVAKRLYVSGYHLLRRLRRTLASSP